MKYSLRTKLTLSYIAIAMICVGLISLFSNILLEKHFTEYVIKNQDSKNSEIISLVKQRYQKEGKWVFEEVEAVGVYALENGIIIKVKDQDGYIIWDAMEHNNGMCEQLISHMARNMYERYPNWKGEYVEEAFPIYIAETKIGSVEIGYYGPFYFNDADLAFITALNKVFIGVGILSLIVSFILGLLISNRMSKPITRVIATAQMIAKGYFGDRCREKSSTKEISQLTTTINDLAETLEVQEKLRKRMTGDVTHELRTPLATLQSHMEAMVDGVWEPSKQRLMSCHEEILRINRMVGDLEKLALVEGENIIIHKSEFDIYELAKRILFNFQSDFANKNIEMIFSGEGLSQVVLADKDKIAQVLVNVISNSLKYTNNGGMVSISITNMKESIEIRIKDTGIGISDEDLPFIFERFYRADKSRNRMTGGSGIGLTIAKAIVEAHKGKIYVQSKLGEGTEFIIELPR